MALHTRHLIFLEPPRIVRVPLELAATISLGIILVRVELITDSYTTGAPIQLSKILMPLPGRPQLLMEQLFLV